MITAQPARKPAFGVASYSPFVRPPGGPSRRSPGFHLWCARPLLAAAFLLAACSAAHCATQSWNPNGNGTGGNGTWNTGVTADWDSGVTWTDGNDALFSGTGGAITVVDPTANSLTFSATGPYVLESGTLNLSGTDVTMNSNATIASVLLGGNGMTQTGTGTLTLTGSANFGGNTVDIEGGTLAIQNAVSNGDGFIGFQPGSNGAVTLSGSGSAWINSGGLCVGYSGTGTLSITNGGAVSSIQGGVIGVGSGSSGTVTLSGTGSSWTAQEGLDVGASGTGALAISSGATVSSSAGGIIGASAGSSGTVTLSGTGSSWTAQEGLDVGDSGTGALAISGGATVSSSAGGIIGASAGASGTVTVDGAGSSWTAQEGLDVGASGTGALVISSGATVSSYEGGVIGASAGASGTVTVDGTGSTWTNGGDLYIGNSGAGSLSITGGATVSNDNGWIGYAAGSSGAVTVSGSGSTWTNGGNLTVGNNGAGTLAITNGGTVSSVNFTLNSGGTLALGENPVLSASNSLSLDGGTVTLVDGQVQTVTLGPAAVGSAMNFDLEVGNGSDKIAFSAALDLNSNSQVNLYGLSGAVVAGTDVLIENYTPGSAPFGSPLPAFSLGDVYNTGNFTYSLRQVGGFSDDLEVVVTSAAAPLTTAYWTGAQGNVWSVAVGGTATNWSTDPAGANDPGLTPSATTDVIFSATSGTKEGNTILGTDVTIDSLTVNDTNAVSISGSDSNPLVPSNDTLTITDSNAGGNAITVNSGAGQVTIGANLSLGGATQNVAVNNAAGLFLTGAFGGSGMTLTGSGTVTAAGPGNFGSGAVDVEGGTLAIQSALAAGPFEIGYSGGSNGAVTLSGTAASLTLSGGNKSFVVGHGGTGSLVISNGASVSSNGMEIGQNGGGVGTVTVTGSGSVLNVGSSSQDQLFIGDNGAGTMFITNGGRVVSGGNNVYIAGDFGSGALTVDGAGSSLNATGPELYIGVAGNASLTVSNGGSVSVESASVGNRPNYNVIATVTGTGSTFVVGPGGLNIGVYSTGTDVLLITNGGSVSTGVNAHNYLAPSGVLAIGNTGSFFSSAYLYLSGGAITLADGVLQKTTIADSIGAISTTALSFDVGNGSDELITGSGISGNSTLSINLYGISGQVTSGTNPLIGGSINSNTATLGNVYNTGNFTYSVVKTSTSVNLVVAPATTPLTTAYWQGGQGNVWSLSTGGTASSWTTDSAGTVVSPLTPSATTDVIFSAADAVNQSNTVLGTDMTINSLTISDTNAVGISGSDSNPLVPNNDTLTITDSNSGGNAIAVNAGAGAVTIGANLSLGGATQNIAVNNAAGLFLTGAFGGSGMTLTGSGTVTAAGPGNFGSGTVDVEGGTLAIQSAFTTGTFEVGNAIGSNGAVTLSGTAASLALSGGNGSFVVGESGTGSLVISNGASVSSDGLEIGQNGGGGVGTVTVTGSGSVLNGGPSGNDQLIIGDNGTGTMFVTNGGEVVTGGNVLIAGNSGSGGLTVDGSGSSLSSGAVGTLYVGKAGPASLTVSNGGSVTAGNVNLGPDSGYDTITTVTGTGSSLTGMVDTQIGNDSSSPTILLIANGGAVTFRGPISVLPSGVLAIGNSGSLFGSSVLDLEGGTITLADGVLQQTTLARPIDNFATTPLDFDVGNGSDELIAGHGIGGNQTLLVNLYGISGQVTSGTDTIIGGSINGNTATLGNVYNTGNFTYSVVKTSASVNIVVEPAATPLTTAYWTGAQGNIWSVAVGGAATNWSTDSAGTIDPGLTPSATTDVIFSASNAVNESNTVLGTNMTINSLTISDTNAVGISGSESNPLLLGTNDTLTITDSNSGGNAIAVSPGAGQVTIGANLSLGGATQNIAVNNAAGLLLTGTFGGSGMTLTGTGTVTAAGPGNFGSGAVDVEGGTLAIQSALTAGPFEVGNATGSNGAVTLSGTAASLTLSGGNKSFVVGASGTGSLVISNGASVSSNGVEIGETGGGVGTVTVTGSGSVLNAGSSGNDQLYIGDNGTGTMFITNGGKVVAPGSIFIAGDFGSGALTVDGSGSSLTANNGELRVGNAGTASLLVSNGGSVSAGVVDLGPDPGYDTITTVTGTGSSLTATDAAQIGNNSSSSTILLIANGGAFTSRDQIILLPSAVLAIGNSGSLAGQQLFLYGGAITLADGVLQQTTLPDSIDATATTSLDFDVGNGSDELITGNGIIGNQTLLVNLYGISGQVTSGTNPLIGGSINGNTATLGNVYNTGNFTYSVVKTSTSVNVVVEPAATPLTTAYWTGAQGNIWSVAVGGAATNWSTDSAGTIDPGLTPSATTDVIFSAADAVNESNTVLGTDMTIDSLTVSDPNAVSISGSESNPALLGTNDTLTITDSNSGGNAIAVNPGAGQVTIGANLSLGGATQNVAVDNAAGLLLTGTVGGAGMTLTGSGAVTIAGSGDFGSGAVNVANGTLAVTGSLTANGLIAASPGATATATVSGAGALWTSNQLVVGQSGSAGSLLISGGGVVSPGSGGLTIGDGAGATGAVTITGTGSTLNLSGSPALLYIGNAGGSGSLLISNGGSLLQTAYNGYDALDIGNGTGSTGSLTITGSGSNWSSITSITVGANGGTGAISITNGGSATIADDGVGITNGTLAVTGSGSRLNVEGLSIYSGGTALIANGGTISNRNGFPVNLFSGGTLAFGGSTTLGGLFFGYGGTVTLVDGELQTINFPGPAVVGSPTDFDFDVGKGADELNILGGHPLDLFGNGIVNLYGLSGQVTSGTDVIISGVSEHPGGSLILGSVYNTGNFKYSVQVPPGKPGELVITAASTPLTTAYWTGAQGNVWSVAVGGTATNWSTDSAGANDPGLTPSATTDVIFSATDAVNQSNTVLGTNMTIDSLTISDTNPVMISGADSQPAMPNNDTLTITDSNSGGNAIAVNAGAGAVTIGANVALGGSSQSVFVNNAGGLLLTGTLTGPALTLSGAGTLTVAGPGSFGGGTVDVEGGTLAIQNTLSNGAGYIGGQPGSNGAVTVSGSGSTWTNSGALSIGESGSGTLNIINGAMVSSSNGGVIGDQAGSTGYVAISGSGGPSAWVDGGDLVISNSGAGTLKVSHGGSVSDANGWIGNGAGSSGLVGISGSGSAWTNSGSLTVGGYGTGTLLVSAGGAVSDGTNYATIYLGAQQGSSGTVTVTGSGSTWIYGSDFFYIGESGTGKLVITHGGAVSYYGISADNVIIGDNSLSDGMVTVSGSGSKWANYSILTIAASGSGTMLINGGGAMSDEGAEIGAGYGSDGEVTVSGSGSKWANDTGLTVGLSGTGTMVINGGGAVSDEVGIIGEHAVHNAGGSVTVTGSGSAWVNSSDLDIGPYGNATLTITQGGLVSSRGAGLADGISPNGYYPAAVVTVSGSGSTWVDNGALLVASSGSATLVISNGGAVSSKSGVVADGGQAINEFGVHARGAVTVTGSGSTWVDSGNLYVGALGYGTLVISNGGAVSSASIGVIGVQGDSSGIATVTGSGSAWTSGGILYVGESGSGTLVVSNGATLSSGSGAIIGDQAGSRGVVVVTGSGSAWTDTGNLAIGNAGRGVLELTHGGDVNVTGTTSIGSAGILEFDGASTLATGLLSINGGTLVTLGAADFSDSATLGAGGMHVETGGFDSTFSGNFSGPGGIVETGSGLLTLTGSSDLGGNFLVGNSGAAQIGGVLSDATGSIGYGAGAATVSGAGSSWTNTGNLFIGASGAGTVTVTTGGALLTEGNSYIGFNAGSSGGATVSGSGSNWTTDNSLAVGYSGTGTLAISTGGSVVSNGNGYIGFNAGSTGAVTLSGSGGWSIVHNLAVGYSGAGTLGITTGGSVSDVNGLIGVNAGSNGAVTLSGSGSTWTNSGSLLIGQSAPGMLTIQNGARVSVNGATSIGSQGTLQFDGASTFSTGFLSINGGTLVTLGAATFTPTATLGTGGMNVDTGGFHSTFSGNFGGTGGIAESGSGVLTLTGVSGYSGPTTVASGTLALTTASAHTAALGNTAISVASGATFAPTLAASHVNTMVSAGTIGSGTAGATLTLEAGSVFSMADGAIGAFYLRQQNAFSGPAFTIGGATGAAPTLTFEIGNAATGPDSIDVTKTVTVLATGGKITIDALAGDTMLTAGSYDLITSAGGFSGSGGNDFTLTDTTLVVDGATYDFSLADSTADDEVLTVSTAAAASRSFVYGGKAGADLLNSVPAVASSRENAPLLGTTAVPEPENWTAVIAALAAMLLLAGRSRGRRKRCV